MPRNSRAAAVADPHLVNPGDIVRLDADLLTPTRGGGHTWPHDAICLYWVARNQALPDVIVSETAFQFVCISSITKARPLDLTRQVRLDEHDPDLGLSGPSAACVDFSPRIFVTVEENRHVLKGVHRYPNRRIKDERVLGFVISLFNQYWTTGAHGKS